MSKYCPTNMSISLLPRYPCLFVCLIRGDRSPVFFALKPLRFQPSLPPLFVAQWARPQTIACGKTAKELALRLQHFSWPSGHHFARVKHLHLVATSGTFGPNIPDLFFSRQQAQAMLRCTLEQRPFNKHNLLRGKILYRGPRALAQSRSDTHP